MGTSSSRRDLDNHESVSLSFALSLWLMPPPMPNLRPMPQLMPGTHTTVTVIPDTTVPTVDTTVLADTDTVDTMVADTMDTPDTDTDTDTGSAMPKNSTHWLSAKPNPTLRLRPILPSSTPASTAMDSPTVLTDTTPTPPVLFMPLPSVMLRLNPRLMLMLKPGMADIMVDTDTDIPDTTEDTEDTMAVDMDMVIMDMGNKPL